MWTQKLYLSDFTACRLMGLLCEKFALTLHGTCTSSAVRRSVLCFDALTLVHYDFTIHNIGQTCGAIMDKSKSIKTWHIPPHCRRRTSIMYSMGDIETCKQLNWIGIIFSVHGDMYFRGIYQLFEELLAKNEHTEKDELTVITVLKSRIWSMWWGQHSNQNSNGLYINLMNFRWSMFFFFWDSTNWQIIVAKEIPLRSITRSWENLEVLLSLSWESSDLTNSS